MILRFAICFAALVHSGVDAGVTFFLSNNLLDASFDSTGTLITLSDVSKKQISHKLAGDGWGFVLGDLPMPTGATVQHNKQVLVNATCPTLPGPPPMTTIDQCAFKCMATDGCAAWTANFDNWVTWGRPRLDCRLHTCAGPFKVVDPTANFSAGLKPQTELLHLDASTCTGISVTQPAEGTLQALHMDCHGFQVNVTYELQPEWHFLTKHLSICRQAPSGGCHPAAGFTVRRVVVWPGIQSETELGAMAMNPYSRKSEFGEAYHAGSGETASFWRSYNSTGLFVSVQTSFFESGEGFGAFRWGEEENTRWGYVNYGAWQLGAAITDTRNFHPAALDGTLNIRGQTAKGGNDVALMLERVAKLSEPISAAVTLVEGQATNKPAATPLPNGFAGFVFGAAATAATATSPASVDGFTATVSTAEGKQFARISKLAGSLQDAHQTCQVLAEVPLNVSSAAPIRLALSTPADLCGLTVLSIDGRVILEVDLCDWVTAGADRGGLGLIVLQQDASFYNFTSSAQKSIISLQSQPSLITGYYSPMMKQVPSLGAVHQADPGVIGLTQLTGYEMPESGVDLGESSAFTRCVEHFLMDNEMRKAGAVRYQVAWDSNEYQLDMSNEADREQYKRLIRRNAELGIKYMVFEPRNTAVSSSWDHSDAWWWEEVLWFQLGIGIRNGSWVPGRDTLPPTVALMLDFLKEQGVGPAAYAYPTLAWRGEGEDEWLYELPERSSDPNGNKASLASPKLQDYLIKTMTRFLEVTGGSGFAWDYGIQGDTRVANMYQEVRGWLRILAALRKAKPDMVMDHRQIAHRFGPWYHLAGSYSEPIAGDENPESYGAALASLSTDHILADNLRLTNYRYRLQLLPNDRVPGFMFHQTERHFNNGTGDDTAGRPGDKIDSNGNALWKADPIPDAAGNYSGITYGNCVVRESWHLRDFDFLGYRYSLISTLGTAGRNLVVANVPARDIEEYNAFPKEDLNWIRKWFDWADTNGEALKRTIPLLGYEWPRLGRVDGTAAMYNNSGFVFLFNPSPDPASAVLQFDESIGLQGGSGLSWLLSEIYPREDGVPVGIWEWQDSVSLPVPGGSARIFQLERWKGSLLQNPIAFNISYDSIEVGSHQVHLTGASGLTGSTTNVVVRLPSVGQSPSAIVINGQSFPGSRSNCFQANDVCIGTEVKFAGSASLRNNAIAAPAPKEQKDSYNASITITSAMLAQLRDRQVKYNITWVEQDLDASWLVPSRLLLYIYVARPTPSLSSPSVLIDGKPAKVIQQYNSRGNHAIVPAGGGAVSGNTARTFMGWYIDCSSLEPDVAHHISVKLPWTNAQRTAHPFSGIYWHNIEDALSTKVGTP